MSFLAVPVLTRMFSREQYGGYTLILSGVSISCFLGFQWLANCALRFYRPLEKRKGALFVHLLISLVFTSMVGMICLAVSWPFLNASYRELVPRVVPLGLLTGTIQCFNAILRAQGRALAFGVIGGMVKVAQYVPGIVAVLVFGAGLRAYAAGWGIGLLVNLVLVVRLTGVWREVCVVRPDWAILKEFLLYGMPVLFVGVANVGINSLDRFIIDYCAGKSEVAYYGVVFQLATMPLLLVGRGVMYAVFPKAVDAYEAKGNYAAVIGGGIRYLLMLGVPVLAILWPLTKEVLAVYAGEQYAAGARAMRFLMFGMAVQSVAQYYRMLFFLHRRTRFLFIIHGGAALVSVAINLLLVVHLYHLGSAIAYASASIAMLALSLVLSRRMGVIAWPHASLWRILLAGSITAGMAWVVSAVFGVNSVLRMFLVVVGLGLLYTVLLFVLGEIREETRVILRSCARLWRHYLHARRDA